MKNLVEMPLNICPKCGKTYCAPPAISRADNRTPICPDCGVREALAVFGCTDEEQKHILSLIHGNERTDQE